jgi:hypothetical protein
MDLLVELGVYSILKDFCDYIINGQYCLNNDGTDIIVVRPGRSAVNHFTYLGEQFVKEVDNREESDIKARYQDLEQKFSTTLKNMHYNDGLVSYEF